MDRGKVRIDYGVMFPLRDGVKLACDIFRPDDDEKHPVLVQKSPYPYDIWGSQLMFAPLQGAEKGYVVILVQDRGRERSEGTWRPYLDESIDTYDAVEWAAVQPWSNGKVGLWGNCGYGYNAFLGAMEQPPHLKAIFTYVSTPNPYEGWTYQTGGAFQLSFMIAWTAVQLRDTLMRSGMPWDKVMQNWYPLYMKYYLSGYLKPPTPQDTYNTLPYHLPLVEQPGISEAPWWREWLTHPSYDEYWKKSDAVARASNIKVPVMEGCGWYDSGALGHIKMHRALSEHSDESIKAEHRLFIGPWDHSAYYNHRETYSGERNFGIGASTGSEFLAPLMFQWFDHWLKDGPVKYLPMENKVRYYQMGENVWKEAPDWPPAHKIVKYYLHSEGRANSRFGDGVLSKETPKVEPVDSYVYDPLNPVISVGGQSMLMATGIWNQQEIEKRQDMLVYTTPRLAESVAIAGPVTVTLYASTNAPDTDFTAKLVDVEPDGYCANITQGIIRARYRNGTDHEDFITPGKVTKYEIELYDTAHTFLPDHCIRLEIASSDFPTYDRNLNSKVTPALATEADAQKAVQQVFHRDTFVSSINLPVV